MSRTFFIAFQLLIERSEQSRNCTLFNYTIECPWRCGYYNALPLRNESISWD